MAHSMMVTVSADGGNLMPTAVRYVMDLQSMLTADRSYNQHVEDMTMDATLCYGEQHQKSTIETSQVGQCVAQYSQSTKQTIGDRLVKGPIN